jgi:enoyl-CoA hydratase/carnithine racemase
VSDLVIQEREAGIVTLTLNVPERRNPISEKPVVDALTNAVLEADSDPDTRAIILTGAGSAFSSGGDVRTMRVGGGVIGAHPAQTRTNYKTGIQRLPLVFDALETPTIAAVNGPAVGAGCDLACMCDIRIAGASAKFAESFVKLGLVAGDGGSWLLQRLVGYAKACELALTGDPVNADEALALGLVSKVVPDADLLPEAKALATRIAANPGYAVRMTKRLLKESQAASLAAILETAASMQAIAHEAPEHRALVEAFLNRKK